MCLAHAAFQQLEVDYYIGAPNQQVFRTDLHETPIIRMYGVTEHGMTFTLLLQRLEERSLASVFHRRAEALNHAWR